MAYVWQSSACVVVLFECWGCGDVLLNPANSTPRLQFGGLMDVEEKGLSPQITLIYHAHHRSMASLYARIDEWIPTLHELGGADQRIQSAW